MADRVFPNNLNVDMGSKISFSGIDWSLVEESMKSNKYAQNSQSEELKKMVDQILDLPEEQRDEIIQEIKDETGEDTHNEIPANEEEKEDSYGEQDDVEASWKEAQGNKEMRKIAFTHPSQISAEAIEAAQAAGDTRLVNTILAARKENRMRIASAIQANIKEASKVAQMEPDPISGFMNDLSPEAKQFLSDPSKSDTEKEEFLNTMNTKNSTPNNDMGFVSAKSFTKSQRKAFVEAALSQGMPIEYINAMCPPQVNQQVAQLSDKVKSVYASNLSEEVKSDVIKNMIKEAKLSSESKSEFIDYWNNILGYQDKSFWPSVAEDYTGAKGDK